MYEDLVVEAIYNRGVDVYYLPRTVVNEDQILKDDIPSRFSDAYKIEVYLNNIDNFGGEGDLFRRFGVEIRDQAEFIMARKRWSQLIENQGNSLYSDNPIEGDLIYFPVSKSLFEIMHVEREIPFYQLSDLKVYRLKCELFEYSDEDFDTGVVEIDSIEQLGYELKVTLDPDSDGDGVFLTGSTINQTLSDGTIVSGEITDYDRSTQILSLAHITTSDGEYHPLQTGLTIEDSDTGATKIVRGVEEDLGDYDYQNDEFDSDVNWLVFDRSNPIGGPS